MQPQDSAIIAYIRQHRSQGFSEQQIKDQLIRHGWSIAATNEAFAQYSRVAAQPPTPVIGNHETKAKKSFSLQWALLVIITCVVAFVAVALLHVHGSSNSVNIANPALQANAQNTERKNDALTILAGIATFSAKNNGSLPLSTAAGTGQNVLDLCGAHCAGSSVVPVTLTYYKNNGAAVHFEPYSSTLTVPDVNTIYIVSNATCTSDNTGIGSAKAGSIVVLYAIQFTASIAQQCAQY